MLTFYVLLHLMIDVRGGEQIAAAQNNHYQSVYPTLEACENDALKLAKYMWDDFEVKVKKNGSVAYSNKNPNVVEHTFQCAEIKFNPSDIEK